MLLADMNISLLASGGIWLLFFLIVFKTLRNKSNGGGSASAKAKAEANSIAGGGNADVGGIAIHIHTGVLNAPNGELISGNQDYMLPANDPVVAQLVAKLLPNQVNSPVEPLAIESEKTETYETVSFS